MRGRLHIVPIMALPRGMEASEVSFSMNAGPSTQPLCIQEPVLRAFGETDMIVVAGTARRRNGWVVPVHAGMAIRNEGVVFEWRCGDLTAMHVIRFDLCDIGRADEPFWTMDSSYWSLGGYAETRRLAGPDRRRIMAVSAFGETEIPQEHQRAIALRRQHGAFIIEERLALHAIEFETAASCARKWGHSERHLESEASWRAR